MKLKSFAAADLAATGLKEPSLAEKNAVRRLRSGGRPMQSEEVFKELGMACVFKKSVLSQSSQSVA